MRNISQYIVEKIQIQTPSNRNQEIAEMFTKEGNPSAYLKDLKTIHPCYFVCISADDASVLGEWECPCSVYIDKYYDTVDGGLGKGRGVQFVLDRCRPKSISEYYDYAVVKITALDMKKYPDLACWEVTTSKAWKKSSGDNWVLFLVPNKENKEQFVKWIKDAHDEGKLPKA